MSKNKYDPKQNIALTPHTYCSYGRKYSLEAKCLMTLQKRAEFRASHEAGWECTFSSKSGSCLFFFFFCIWLIWNLTLPILSTGTLRYFFYKKWDHFPFENQQRFFLWENQKHVIQTIQCYLFKKAEQLFERFHFSFILNWFVFSILTHISSITTH